MNYTEKKISKPSRKYFSEDLDITKWENVEKELQKLVAEEITSKDELIEFLEKVGELSDIISEEMAWRYITMTRFADQEKNSENFNKFYRDIVSNSKPYHHKFNHKFYESPYRKDLTGKEYRHLNRIISNDIKLFREENIPLQAQETELANKYGSEFSKLTVQYDGEEKTLSQLAPYLKKQDRKVREEVWTLRAKKMAEKREHFNKLFDEMKTLRIKEAKNAGFSNYRDYMHQSKGRFSYTPNDLIEFHKAVEKEVIPFLTDLAAERKEKLDLAELRPWDISVDLDGKTLKPFKTIDEFIDKGIAILHEVNPDFGQNLNKMKNSGLLDLENRKGKAPGGYNYPLQETGAPFIFMNAVGLHRNIVTLLHESGHAMHSFATKDIKIDAFKHTPSEVAELASMSMEFFTMDQWDKYYQNEDDFKKAKRDQLKSALGFLPWCMTVDAFQHWVYLNPEHTIKERDDFFVNLSERFNAGVNWQGLEDFRRNLWLFQLHIFEVPFYYIEYGMSQLGALAMYRNFKEKGEKKTLQDYENFLRLGYTVPVSDLYETAGIKFDFSAEYVRELVDFVRQELEKLK